MGPKGLRELAIQIAVILAARFEGLVLVPYRCAAGVPTIGYGATYYPNGRRVKLTDPPITKEFAQQMLVWMVTHIYLPKVVKLCPGISTPERLAAIIDFTFNLGAGNLQASTLRKRINQGRWDLAKVELMRWVRAGGRVLKGLIRRREAEAALI